MSLDFLANQETIADIAELKQIGTSTEGKLTRSPQDRRMVRNVDFGLKNHIYHYRPDLDFIEALPAFVKPSDNQGTWIMANNPFIVATTKPANPPSMAGLRYYANLSSPDRAIEYFALTLSDPAITADWVPVREPLEIDGAPTFEPDYQGQKVRDLNTGIEYGADGTAANSGSWVPTSIIKGDAIAANKTIALSDRNRWFSFGDGHTLTLPAGLTQRVYFELVGATPTATITLAPDSGASLVGDSAVVGSARIRNDGSTWYRF